MQSVTAKEWFAFFNKVHIPESRHECWEWTGSKSAGYGHIRRGGKDNVAHRVSYETFVGKIPEGLVIDHLCRNTGCVNPSHLEPVEHKTNINRGVFKRSLETHCRKGHEFTAENTLYDNPRRPKARACRECRRKYKREWMRRKTGCKNPRVI